MIDFSILAKITGVGLAIWALGRGIRGAHRLDRAGSLLRWSMVILSAFVYVVSLRTPSMPFTLAFIDVATFTLFFFLPDLSYYLVMGARKLSAIVRGDRNHRANSDVGGRDWPNQ
jgi:hypothetical protein